MKIQLIKTRLLPVLLTFLIGVTAASAWYFFYYRPASIAKHQAEIARRRNEVEKMMLTGSYHHDGAIELISIGEISSVPALLEVLKENPPMKDGNMVCITSHALDALRKITKHDAGDTYEEWRAWWKQHSMQPSKGSLTSRQTV